MRKPDNFKLSNIEICRRCSVVVRTPDNVSPGRGGGRVKSGILPAQKLPHCIHDPIPGGEGDIHVSARDAYDFDLWHFLPDSLDGRTSEWSSQCRSTIFQ